MYTCPLRFWHSPDDAPLTGEMMHNEREDAGEGVSDPPPPHRGRIQDRWAQLIKHQLAVINTTSGYDLYICSPAVYGLFSAQLYMIAKKSRQETTSHTAAATGEKSGVGSTSKLWLWFNLLVLGCASTYLYLVVVVVQLTNSTWLWSGCSNHSVGQPD